MTSISPIVQSFTTQDGIIQAPTDEVDRALQNITVKPKRTKKTKNKDPNAPKRPMSAYLLWLNENRTDIADEYFADLTGRDRVTSITKKAGALWGELTDDEKEPFNVQSKALREQYKVLKAEYVPPEGFVLPTKSSFTADVEHIPDAKDSWTGPFKMKYLKGKVR